MRSVSGAVLVTGGGSGIGRECCRYLASVGYTVLVNDVHEAAANDVAREIGGHSVHGDLGGECADIVARVGSLAPALRGLVNNAGIQRKVPLKDVCAEDLDPLYRVNLRAPMLLSAGLFQSLVDGGGSIVNIASMSGITPQPGAGFYTASKAALIAFTEQASVEFGPSGVRVNAVCPGLVRTPMSESIYADEGRYGARKEFVPIKRIGTAEEIALATEFLLSERASYITGVALKVDGGVCNALMTAFP